MPSPTLRTLRKVKCRASVAQRLGSRSRLVFPSKAKVSESAPAKAIAPAASNNIEVPTTPLAMGDALTMYMRAVGEVPLLTPKEEAKLAAKVRRGDDRAREHLIRANLRFVIKIAREYEHLGLPLLDLINEGNIGLMLAVDRFDPRKGAKLTTYSSWWIRQSIRRALASQGKTIRLPVYVVDQVYHLGKAEVRLREELGRDATPEELAEEMKLSTDRVSELLTARVRPTSLDAPLGDDDSSRLADVVADENAEVPGQSLDQGTSLEMLRELLPKLPAREANILRLRFGLDGGVEKTLEEIGALMRLTRERIRQLQNVALAKLRRMMQERDSVVVAA
ncbi:MAG: sigma-70 family RNA polymerase sigma factor [Planctomycetaceae bacterium]|nr:sigma-70 family RNA polymerase sigma factor [Planctomycetaceae bacterium]